MNYNGLAMISSLLIEITNFKILTEMTKKNETSENNKAINYEPLLGVVRVRWGDYMVHLETRQHTLQFECYPVTDWTKVDTGGKGMSYHDKEEGINEMHDEFKEGECLKKLEGSFCWRGVWEGRLYFPEEEYWGEEIAELSELYNDYILPWCKNFIKERDPHDYYD